MKNEIAERSSGEIASLRKTLRAREKVLARMLKDDGKTMRLEKLKSTDLAFFLSAGIKIKFRRGQDEVVGDLFECSQTCITLENVQGRYASRAEYHVWNEEEFWPLLRHMDDMSLEEVKDSEVFDSLLVVSSIVTRAQVGHEAIGPSNGMGSTTAEQWIGQVNNIEVTAEENDVRINAAITPRDGTSKFLETRVPEFLDILLSAAERGTFVSVYVEQVGGKYVPIQIKILDRNPPVDR